MNSKKIIPYILLILITPLLLQSLGTEINFTNIFSVSVLLLLSYNIKTIYIPLSILIILLAFYYPTGLLFGKPNSGYFASLYYTNIRESFEYIKQLNIQHLFISIAIILITIFTITIKRVHYSPSIKVLQIFLIIVILDNSFIPRYIKDIKNSISIFIKEKNSLTHNIKSDWEVTSNNNNNKIYILIIGESVRKDYLSLYGYKYDTTPFLNKENGIIIDGLVSPGPNTATSLTRMLALSKDGYSTNNNIITLAKKAKISTYWLSNQGTFGKYDSPISNIAINSDYTFFINEKSFSTITNDDFNLLPMLYRITKKDNNKKLIVLHMMGSHPKTCERLNGFENIFKDNISNPDISCYLSTINKLDTFIKKIIYYLKKENYEYSILYISDHGMDVSENAPFIKVNNIYKQNYEVPLFILDSQTNEKIYIKRNLSGFNFISFFSNWMEIDERNLMKYDLNDFPIDNNINVWNWNEYVQYTELKEQGTIKE